MSYNFATKALLAGFISITLVACSNEQAPVVSETVRPVKLITIGTEKAEEINRFPAVVKANKFTELSLQVGGKLEEFPVKEAQEIKTGDLIAKIDPSDYKSAVASAKAQFDNAKNEYERAKSLAGKLAISKSDLEQRKTQFDVSKNQLDQAQKALADTILRAPFDGVIAQTFVNQLQTVSAGQVIVSIIDEGLNKATADLPASFVAKIPRETAEDENNQAFIILDANPNEKIPGEFSEATLIADASSQTYAVSFTFPTPDNINVLPGMNATIELHHKTNDSLRVAVPAGAINNDGNSDFTWLVDSKTMTVHKQVVTIEPGIGRTMIVSQGLNSGDTIVGAGAAYLSEGMKIKEWK
ncbi:efflux RND transporter periplasmic adaptor subunit [uncultured Pseudoteredinibacter sp.]|uniref:efflux RND transporter periplasmic adaptor subunit n=1 Tax=uncultured Pseudoteredinibacter sp. TaxID=1641701 RepID=UPI002637EF98|nr:efflux RND transporter periplasmic adaptor subunit [uncultured Pseudoteredinibacter sp.]